MTLGTRSESAAAWVHWGGRGDLRYAVRAEGSFFSNIFLILIFFCQISTDSFVAGSVVFFFNQRSERNFVSCLWFYAIDTILTLPQKVVVRNRLQVLTGFHFYGSRNFS